MIFLPIVGREMRAAARRSSTYWSRAQIAAAALIPTFFLLLGPMEYMSMAQQGSRIFEVLAFLAFLYAMMAAVRHTADSISREKREGTLGFLFLTDLKSYDVVFGKLAATSCAALYGLLASLPVLSIPVLLGGVTFGDLLRLALVLLNTLFFSLSLAIFVSSICWQEKKAVGVTLLLLSGFGIGLPIAGSIAREVSGADNLGYWLSIASPGHACGRISSAGYAASPRAFWFSSAITHCFGWLFLALACRVLPRVWQDRPAAGKRLRWREWCRRALMGDAAARLDCRRVFLAMNPIFWLASRERRTAWYPWIFLVSIGAIVLFTCWILRTRGIEFAPLILCTIAINWFFKHWITNAACYALSTDRDKGALELLLSTPLKVREVVNGHWMALRRQFLAPVIVLLLVEIVCFFAALVARSQDGTIEPLVFIMIYLLVLGIFVADLIALVWVGLWSGVIAKNASSAVSSTYVRIMILPWGITAITLIAISIFVNLQDLHITMLALLTWTAGSILADVGFGIIARRKLLNELRLAAVERYSGDDPSLNWWRRIGRAAGRWFAATPPESNRAS